MDRAAVFRRTAAAGNRLVLPVLNLGPVRRLFAGSVAVLHYRGRRSGRPVTLPVNYRRDPATGDLVVRVLGPQAKTWWRNFTGDGAPVRVTLGSDEVDGHGVVERDADVVRVRIRQV